MLAGAAVMLIAVTQLFTPRGDVSAAGMALWSVVLWLGPTMVVIPYHAWGAELSGNYHRRTRIATSRTLCSVAGILAAIALPLLSGRLFGYGDELEEALTLIAVLAVTTGCVAFTWLLTRVGEPAPLEVRAVPALEGLRVMWQNAPFKRLLTAFALAGLGPAMAAPVFFFYLAHVIVVDLAIAIPLLVFCSGNLLGVALWWALAEQIGKRRAWMAAMWLMVISQPGFPAPRPRRRAAVARDPVSRRCQRRQPRRIAVRDAGRRGGPRPARQRRRPRRADLLELEPRAEVRRIDRAGFPADDPRAVDFEPSGPNGPFELWTLKIVFAGLPTLCYAAALLVIRSYPLSEERHRHVLRQLSTRPPAMPTVASGVMR